jgi:hypothetical protein
VLLVAAFVAAALFAESHIRSHTDEMVSLAEEAMRTLDEQGFDACAEVVEALISQWGDVHDAWETINAHQRLTEVDEALIEASWAVEGEDREQTLAQLDLLRLLLSHLSEHYSISLANLL